jgi:hypothetical protein
LRFGRPIRRRAPRQRFDHVRPAPDAAIDNQRHAALHSLGDQRKRVDSRGHGVQIACAVVGDDDSRDPRLHGNRGVIGIENALQQYGTAREAAKPVDIFPGERRVEVILAAQIRQLAIGQLTLGLLFAIARAEGRRIDGHAQRAAAGIFGALPRA